VANPKRTSPDQLLPYYKKISAEGKAQMICFISYTYMVLKRRYAYISPHNIAYKAHDSLIVIFLCC
ncbi:hypothetical protein, partial [Anaerotignum lactatifermentans]|uniref:hypothetical protein n=1 Tax=Anaerotignum lactatifermentans TaxID=160404 RepID=UPI003AB3F70F